MKHSRFALELALLDERGTMNGQERGLEIDVPSKSQEDED